LITIAVEFRAELVTMQLTIVCSTARFTCSSPFGLGWAEGLLFATSSPVMADFPVMNSSVNEIGPGHHLRRFRRFCCKAINPTGKAEDNFVEAGTIKANEFDQAE
jgi:hypothetical protein